MTNLLRDARFGFRLLLMRPGFTAVAVLTLALGIASTTTIFSVVHATFFAPLPYREADRLAMVWSQARGPEHDVPRRLSRIPPRGDGVRGPERVDLPGP